ncbi:unnamed protein product [Larinioides sclopetarius]|uniref:Uncharacterized protein n=1 Tax=Larinioides sclopetarius TaxID=280406 RepID=A0AAV2C2A4_9ARAC
MKPESNEVWKGHDLHIISLSLESSCLILNGDSSDCSSSATRSFYNYSPLQLPVNFTLSMVNFLFYTCNGGIWKSILHSHPYVLKFCVHFFVRDVTPLSRHIRELVDILRFNLEYRQKVDSESDCRKLLGISIAIGDGHICKGHSFAMILGIGGGLLKQRLAGLSDRSHGVVKGGVLVGGGDGLGHGVVLGGSEGFISLILHCDKFSTAWNFWRSW